MQRGSLVKVERKNGPDVWQFRWSEKGGDGGRVYRKRVIGTIEQYSDAAEAQQFSLIEHFSAPGDFFFAVRVALKLDCDRIAVELLHLGDPQAAHQNKHKE
jgi:hypothetical protein